MSGLFIIERCVNSSEKVEMRFAKIGGAIFTSVFFLHDFVCFEKIGGAMIFF